MLLDNYDLGPCCNCGSTGDFVRNILMMKFTAPESGKGWGCFQCDLPNDGAVAVLCDGCLEQISRDQVQIPQVCIGEPGNGKRVAVTDYEHEPFDHNLRLHPEMN